MFKLTKEQEDQIVDEIRAFFLNERDEDLSEFAASNVLHFVKESLAPHFYNAALTDAKYAVSEQIFKIEEEILALERPIKKK